MPSYKSAEAIRSVIDILNKRLYNAGYCFKVYVVDSYFVYVQASFDFSYYVNLHLEFCNYVYTNLKENEQWPDAWHDNQIFILDENEIQKILDSNQVELSHHNDMPLFGFRFNMPSSNMYDNGIVICKEVNIRWEHPYYD